MERNCNRDGGWLWGKFFYALEKLQPGTPSIDAALHAAAISVTRFSTELTHVSWNLHTQLIYELHAGAFTRISSLFNLPLTISSYYWNGNQSSEKWRG